MPPKTKIFFLGATGYIGGTVLRRLLQHPTAPKLEITALVHTAHQLSLFTRIGVKTITGDLDALALLERQASESDVVFACANNNHVPSKEAILKGFKKRHELTGTAPIFIHTSGTDLIDDDAQGMYPSDIICDDMDIADLARIGLRRSTDRLLLEADKQGYVRTSIIFPSSIYGFASGRLVELGIQNPHSYHSQIPYLVRTCLARRRAGMVGLGRNLLSHIHVDDLGDLYIIVYNAILDGRARHGLEGMYFAENGESTSREVSEQVGKAFVEFGVSRPGEGTPTSFDETEYANPESFDIDQWWGRNDRCTGSRGRLLGWEPKYTTKDMLKYARHEVEWQLKHKDDMY